MSQGWFELKVVAKSEEAQGIFRFELASPDGRDLPEFEAGSHLEVSIENMIRHYSLASSPLDRGRYVLGIQREQNGRGGSLTFCDTFDVGKVIQVRGPHNLFKLVPDGRSYLLLAGGIGITPIMSMAEALWAEGKEFRFHYSVRTKERMAFYEALMRSPFADKVVFHFDDGAPEQRLNLSDLLSNPETGAQFYFCGPPAMIDAAVAEARAKGWAQDQIHYERFSAAPVAGENMVFQIVIKSTGQKIIVPPEKTAVQVLAEAGYHIPVSCEQGVCGTCVTKVVEGIPEHRDSFLLDDEKSSNSLFMPCCSRARSDVLVLDLSESVGRVGGSNLSDVAVLKQTDTGVGGKITLDALLADPYPIYGQLREHEPVAWVPAANRFLVTRFRDVTQIERQPDIFSSVEHHSMMHRAIGETMLRLDGADHKRFRSALEPALRQATVRARWTEAFGKEVDKLIDRLYERGEADLFHDFAGPLAAECLGLLLGFRGLKESDMRLWSQAIIDGCGNYGDDQAIWTRCNAASSQIDTLIDELVPYFEKNPDDSILSTLINSDAKFTRQEIKSNLMVIIGGGVNEPRDATSVATYALLADPAQRTLVEADPSKWISVFEESVRWVSPVGMYPRVTTRRVEIGGSVLEEGSRVGVVIGSANRDESVFERPDVFDIRRPQKSNLAFGGGAHFCLGAWAARVQVAELALPALFKRLPKLRLSAKEQVRWGGWVFRGPLNLPVEWDV